MVVRDISGPSLDKRLPRNLVFLVAGVVDREPYYLHHTLMLLSEKGLF